METIGCEPSQGGEKLKSIEAHINKITVEEKGQKKNKEEIISIKLR